MEFLIKNGSTRIIQDLKDDIFKIRTLQECSYHVDGIEKCRGIREKAKSICDIIADPERLEEEREFYRKNRAKFESMKSGQGSDYIGGNSSIGGNSNIGSYDYKSTRFSMETRSYTKKVIVTRKHKIFE